MIKLEFLQLESKSDWILHTSQYFDDNFLSKNRIMIKLVALES